MFAEFREEREKRHLGIMALKQHCSRLFSFLDLDKASVN